MTKKKSWVTLGSKIALLAGIIFVSFAFVRFLYIQRLTDLVYVGALADKHAYLDQQKSPRLILLGGSNVLFGVNSDTLQNNLHLPVINMALMAPLGLDFIMGDLEKDLRKGDIVLLSAEYGIEAYGDTESQLAVADFYYPAEEFVVYHGNWKDKFRTLVMHQIKMLKDYVSLKSANLSQDNLIYFRKAISPKGDLKSHQNKPSRTFDAKSFPKDSIDYGEQIEVINSYIKRYQAKGAVVYFVYPNLAKTTFDYGNKAVHSVESQLNEKLACKIIAKPEDFVYPDSLFFDTYYHLKPKARDIRTKKLLENLKTSIPELKNATNVEIKPVRK